MCSATCRLAQEYGLELRFHADFQTVFAEEQGDPYFSNLLRRMKVMDAEGNAEMDEDQLDAASESMGSAPVFALADPLTYGSVLPQCSTLASHSSRQQSSATA